jgi:UDP-N-acetylglucosamine--N-acetylmuramyl-(pentapeptide) pyrophosphoryl-undecaprenol N-acetylglucosamine transferase
MKVLVAGGGTGGHIYPAVAVIESLKVLSNSVEVVFVGTGRGLETGIVPSLGYRMHKIVARPLPREKGPGFIVPAVLALVGIVQSTFVLLKERPDAVIGTGGYASGPCVLAASLAGTPTLYIEPNRVPGRTTMMLSRFVDEVALGFQECVRFFRKGTNLRVTGVPVRPGLLEVGREAGTERFGLDPGRKTVFVFGGSRGASSINKAIVDAVKALGERDDLQFVIQTGEADYEYASTLLAGASIPCRVYPYIEDIGYAYAASDLVVSRAGAVTLAELTARGLPAVLVPYPYATGRHQDSNALSLAEKEAAIVIGDSDLSGERLAETIDYIVSDPGRLAAMAAASGELGKPDASSQIAMRLVELARRQGRLSKLGTVLSDLCSVR